jgi:pimeloyl-ACP methyl ester carboxylesterase
MLENSEIRFLPLGARRVAYEIRGDGPPLVAPAWWVSHLELDWQGASFRRFWEGVADGHTLIRYDRLGVGMSDRTVDEADLTIDGEVATLRALLDELEFDRVSLIGGSCGSCTAVAFAAAYPERVDRLVLYGSYPDGAEITAPGVGSAIVGAVRAHWGLGSRLLSDIFLGGADADEYERFARLQREAASAETAAALLDLVYRLDVRARLPLVRQPALVLHRRDDRAVPYRLGREVAAAIPGSTFVPLPGAAHFPWHGDVDSVVRACRGARPTARAELGRSGLRAAVRSRTGGARLRRARPERSGDRRAVGSQLAHRAPPRRQHPSQAGPHLADRGRRRSRSTRVALSHGRNRPSRRRWPIRGMCAGAGRHTVAP